MLIGIVAYWVFRIQYTWVIGPGNDAGNWISIAYSYIGGTYPGQVSPYGYPPLVFPLVGMVYLATGSNAVATAHDVVPILLVLLGISLYALARQSLKSIVVSLAFLALVLLDPYFLVMFFWGAWPNLLGFVFLNFALIGLIWTGQGRSNGPLLFWLSASATILSHSLVAVELAALLFTLFFLAIFIPFRTPSAVKKVDDPGRIAPALFLGRKGILGFVVLVATVGGWYAATAAFRIAHPGYFGQSGAQQIALSYGLFFRNVLPGLTYPPTQAYYLLIGLVVLLLLFYAMLLRFRSTWVSTPALLLLCSWLSVMGLGIIGWNLQISTDYHRFAFLLIIPGALGIAYLIDRAWISARPRAVPTSTAPVTPAAVRDLPLEERVARWRPRLSSPHKVEVFGGSCFLIGLLLAVTVTAPGLAQDERQFSGPGHDQPFLDALNSIRESKVPGSILTVSQNLKWTWAITHRNAYAPRPGSAFLFYSAQVRDAALSYYALTTSYALTNGAVSAGFRGTNPALLSGIPDYSVYQAGALVPALRVDPLLVEVTLVNRTTGLPYTVGLNLPPTYTAAPSAGSPAVITYVEPGFDLTQAVTVLPGAPEMFANITATATGPDAVLAVSEVLSSPNALTASVVPGAVPGTFAWAAQAVRYRGLSTLGIVSPASGLQGVTPYYPPAGGPAVVLSFTAPPGGAPFVNGSLELDTPLAGANIPGLPWSINTQQIWQSLGIRFILFPNKPFTTIYPGAIVSDETTFLTEEFGCTVLEYNSEWIVYEVPS